MSQSDMGNSPLPTTVELAPGRDLALADVVGVARGAGNGAYAHVTLGGDWRARCQRSASYVRQLLEATQGKDDASLALLVRQRFGEAPPRSLSALLTEPQDHAPTVRALASRALVYGVTTGLGNNKDKPLRTREEARQLQVNLLRSHAAGVGPPAPIEVVRATMLLRARSFVEGFSGVRPELVDFVVAMLNAGIHPWVPQQGSVGSSGDLCPLSHLFLSVLGEGLGWRNGSPASVSFAPGPPTDAPLSACMTQVDLWDAPRPDARPMREHLHAAGIDPLPYLEAKEGLALTNGTTFTTAYAALACWDAARVLDHANLAASMSLQALKGCTRALDPKVHEVRRHGGQVEAAQRILALTRGGALLDSSDDVQDAYSLRCAPQVHGAATTALRHAREVVAAEINAVTDNPLFLMDEARWPDTASEPTDGFGKCIWSAYSAGNFHGEPVGMVMDYLKIAVAELAGISERRVQHLLDRHHNRGLPANLASRGGGGLESGLMIAQYTAASLVSENKGLAHPASVDSIPTSANAEDHVAMAPIAARQARQIIQNTVNVVSIELLCAAQALEVRVQEAPPHGLCFSPSAAAVLALMNRSTGQGAETHALGGGERLLWPRIAAVRQWMLSGEIARGVEEAVRT